MLHTRNCCLRQGRVCGHGIAQRSRIAQVYAARNDYCPEAVCARKELAAAGFTPGVEGELHGACSGVAGCHRISLQSARLPALVQTLNAASAKLTCGSRDPAKSTPSIGDMQ